ncbi:DNA-binding domain-containing protein [bacterium]|jgi:hypothetical protein|nr:DNA-binding domain-containing protein [bacterium]
MVTDFPKGKPLSLSKFQQLYSKLTKDSKPDSKILATLIAKRPPLSSRSRMEIYRYAYFARILEVLESDFPQLRKKIGKRPFAKLMREYLAAYPSRYANISEVGKNLSVFLRKKKKSPLANLAALDWEMSLSSFAPSIEHRDFSNLLSLPEDQILKARLYLDPSVRLLKTDSHYLIFGPHGKAQFQTVTPLQYRLIQEIKKHQPLSKLLSLMTRSKISEDFVVQWFTSWSKQGIIAGYE